MLVFEDVDGWVPGVGEWGRVQGALDELAEVGTPCPVEVPRFQDDGFQGWRSLAGDPVLTGRLDGWCRANVERFAELESGWAAAVAGDSLVHGDLRADNILLTEERVYFVDWPHAAKGAPWADLVFLAPSWTARGGPPAAELWAGSGWKVDRDALNAVVAAVAGYFAHSALLPPPPGLPTLREFQRAQAGPALEWLRQGVGS
ncbi:Ser/Thr protein kinase RdoA (MazF antagonist) [Actinokineospora baliensis]|nr:Ser/Thr protein kinase RdoA (MazF antagonist) [Actinokineospora baliensis]